MAFGPSLNKILSRIRIFGQRPNVFANLSVAKMHWTSRHLRVYGKSRALVTTLMQVWKVSFGVGQCLRFGQYACHLQVLISNSVV